MNDRFFLDTNIIVYSFDHSAPHKMRRAQDLIAAALEERNGIISFQVIQEFASVATRKLAKPFSYAEFARYLDDFLGPLCEIWPSFALYKNAKRIEMETGYSFYDSLILAAATEAHCNILYTEDLQNKRQVGEVMIVNPF